MSRLCCEVVTLFSIMYSVVSSVGDIEHYAITFIQIVAPSGKPSPKEAWV
jgi:hypothetical protein